MSKIGELSVEVTADTKLLYHKLIVLSRLSKRLAAAFQDAAEELMLVDEEGEQRRNES